MRLFAPLALLLLLLNSSARAAQASVDVALVLLTDVSRSIDDSEFRLEKRGYVAALQDKRVLDAIAGGPAGAIAVAYVEFAGSDEVRTVLDWHTVRTAADAQALADEIGEAPRSAWGRTSISSGIDHSVALLGQAPARATRLIIDVAGDGTNNSGRDVRAARDDALAKGVIINGIAIINENPANLAYAHVQPPGGLPTWYQANVIGGQGSFVLEVRNFQTFRDAMVRKLLSEIATR
jgi:Protein of unknown function (DUF1194)